MCLFYNAVALLSGMCGIILVKDLRREICGNG